MMDQSMLPAHLRDDAPTARCNRCGRQTVAMELFGRKCTMPQPNRPSCGGTFSDPRGLPIKSDLQVIREQQIRIEDLERALRLLRQHTAGCERCQQVADHDRDKDRENA